MVCSVIRWEIREITCSAMRECFFHPRYQAHILLSSERVALQRRIWYLTKSLYPLGYCFSFIFGVRRMFIAELPLTILHSFKSNITDRRTIFKWSTVGKPGIQIHKISKIRYEKGPDIHKDKKAKVGFSPESYIDINKLSLHYKQDYHILRLDPF